jgi:hypothetical protein
MMLTPSLGGPGRLCRFQKFGRRDSRFHAVPFLGYIELTFGQAGRASALKEFIEYALEMGDVWIARRIDIANWWNEHHEEFK